MSDAVAEVWRRITTCLGEHASSSRLRDGASEAAIAEVEQALGLELPADYKAWLRLHDGEDDVQGRVEWLPAWGRLLPIAVTLERWRDEQEWAQTDDDEIPGPKGTVGQVIVATTECDFELVGTSFLDFLTRWASAFEAGTLTVRTGGDSPRVDWTHKANPWDRWEAALRNALATPL
jgi:cell wall assembly regulator SMI1